MAKNKNIFRPRWREILIIIILSFSSAAVFNSISVSGVSYLYHPPKIDDGKVFSLYEAKKTWEASEAVFVDARNVYQYKKGHIPGAINVSYQTLDPNKESALQDVDKNANLVVYCFSATCNQANILAVKLRQSGFKRVAVFEGGFKEWQRAGYPLESEKR